jgi:serine/threonine protein kinase
VEGFDYTNKVDIWALGCIFYEVIFERKAFVDDLAVLQYTSGVSLETPHESKAIKDPETLRLLTSLIWEMLKHGPFKRPKALDVQKRLGRIHGSRAQSSPSLISTRWRVLQTGVHNFLKQRLPFPQQICYLYLRFVSFTMFAALVVEGYSNFSTDFKSLSGWEKLLPRIKIRFKLSWLRIAAVVAGISLRITFLAYCRSLGAFRPIQLYEERVREIRRAPWQRLWAACLVVSIILGYLDKSDGGSFLLIASLAPIVMFSTFIH